MQISPTQSSIRIPSLDGLRAISIALVLLMHMSGANNFVSYRAITPFNVGALGVKIFFVISAFLITTLLLKEQANTGKISLRAFYIRRARRILPAFSAYLLVIAFLVLAGLISVRKWDLLHALTFTMNYGYHSWWVGHIWSLSAEEQFYLLWPVALCYFGRNKGMMLVAAVAFAVPIVRFALYVSIPSYHHAFGYSFETCADSFAIGCLLAGFREWLGEQPKYLHFLKSWMFLFVPVGILLGSMSYVRPRVEALVGVTVENICIALLVDRAIRLPAGRFGRVLNSRPFVYVGTLSYSIYLWQQLFCRRVEFQNWSTAFPANLILLSACALTCFYLIEQPALRFRGGLTMGKNRTQPNMTGATTATAES